MVNEQIGIDLMEENDKNYALFVKNVFLPKRAVILKNDTNVSNG